MIKGFAEDRVVTDAEIDTMGDLLKIQGSEGNFTHSAYMHGMYNGMELIVAMIADRKPNFRSCESYTQDFTADEIEHLLNCLANQKFMPVPEGEVETPIPGAQEIIDKAWGEAMEKNRGRLAWKDVELTSRVG